MMTKTIAGRSHTQPDRSEQVMWMAYDSFEMLLRADKAGAHALAEQVLEVSQVALMQHQATKMKGQKHED